MIDTSKFTQWDDPINDLIDHHLTGLTLIYFKMAFYGNISEVRKHLENHLGLGRVIKAINFIGDGDNNSTELCILAKNLRAIVARACPAAAEILKKANRVLCTFYLSLTPIAHVGATIEHGHQS